MRELESSSDELVSTLLALEEDAQLALLDSCGRTLGNSRFLVAGIYPTESFEFKCQTQAEAFAVLQFLDEKLDFYQSKSCKSQLFGGGICTATLAYEFGLLLEDIKSDSTKQLFSIDQPSATFNFYETFIVHDYMKSKTFVIGKDAAQLEKIIKREKNNERQLRLIDRPSSITSNFSKEQYLSVVREIQQHIALGDVYQANLTQQFRAELSTEMTPQTIFKRLRTDHPAPFAAFIKRKNDFVVSISPERFLKVGKTKFQSERIVIASPIKGTRQRGKTSEEDARLRSELETSFKDRAENVMIVDLLRNDIGRVCEFGSVKLEKLCELETHETLFHLVSTIEGRLRADAKTSDLLAAAFPSGSITGAPKIRAMQILNQIETARRGLSMGAIGYLGFDGSIDLNVAIRTIVVRENAAMFNVGGGIVFDSQPEAEYEESLVKAQALFKALNIKGFIN